MGQILKKIFNLFCTHLLFSDRPGMEKKHIVTRSLLCIKHHDNFSPLHYLLIQDYIVLSGQHKETC